jgi:hypothetical protein
MTLDAELERVMLDDDDGGQGHAMPGLCMSCIAQRHPSYIGDYRRGRLVLLERSISASRMGPKPDLFW